MDGNSTFAPASNNTCPLIGPVLTAIVNIPAATPACTPIGAFSTTIASLGFTPLSAEPSDRVPDGAYHILHQRRLPSILGETYRGSCVTAGLTMNVVRNR